MAWLAETVSEDAEGSADGRSPQSHRGLVLL